MQYFLSILVCFLLISLTRPAKAAFEQELILDNGLKVIMAPQPANPLLTVRLVVKTGSGGEGDRADFGLAHLIEHMAFKSTAGGRAEGQIAWEVESAGGTISAYTWLDETVYHLTLPAEDVEKAFDILRDMVFFPAYEPNEFAREKEVVIEEIKKYADMPGDLLANNLYEMIFDRHAYAHPVIGFEETIREVGLDRIRAFLDRHYRSDNIFIVVSGGFNPVELKRSAAEYFGTLTKQDRVWPSPPKYPPSNANQGPELKSAVSGKTDLVLIEIGFRAYAGQNPDSVPSELLASVLSQTEVSRLDEKVKSELALVTSISCYSSSFREAGLFSIYLETEIDQVTEAVSAIFDELERLPHDPPDLDELQRVRALSTVYYLSQQESSEGLGRTLSESEIFQGDWRLKDARLSQWARVMPDDLLRVASEMFRPDNMHISLVWPEEVSGRQEEIEKAIMARARVLTLDGQKIENQTSQSFQETVSWPGGPRLALRPDSSLPLIVIKAGVPGGLLAEQKGEEGLASLTAEVWPMAAGGLDRSTFLRAAERIGATFTASSGRNTFFLTAHFPSENKDEGLRLMAQIIKNPRFSADDLEEARQDRLADLRQQSEDPAARVALISRTSLYGKGHPYSLNPLGTQESVESIKPEDMVAYISRVLRPQKLVVAAVGDFDSQWLVRELKENLADWRLSEEGSAVPVPPEPRFAISTTVANEVLDRAQSHLRISFPVAGLGHPDQAALEVLSDYLGGGMGGPMFMELREKRGLAYDLYAQYLPGLNSGELSFYIATDPVKTREAREGLEAIIARFREQSLSQEELKGARLQTLGKRKRAEETSTDQADEAMLNLLYGLGLDFEAKYQDQITALSAANLNQAAKKYLVMDRAVVAVVGPELGLE